LKQKIISIIIVKMATLTSTNATNFTASTVSTDVMPSENPHCIIVIDTETESALESCDTPKTVHSNSSNIFYGSLCKQMDKRQDMGVHGTYEKGYYIGAFDGHGTNACIQLLRNLDYRQIANDPLKIIDYVFSDIDVSLYNSGSTMNFTTIQMEDDIIVTNYNVGDSECIIFVNGVLVFESVPHTLHKPGERERLLPFLADFKPFTGAWAPIPLSGTRMTVQRSDICHYKTGESLVPTMALGHNNMTDFVPDVHTMRFKSTDHVRIVSGSDGFWGMIVKTLDEDKLKTMTLEQLVDFAEKRWKQEWEYAADIKNPNKIEITSFPGYDDITVCIWDSMYLG
jgi:serine/threonine protein phosphatase PrpC